uniref:Papilin n=1 Tax=Cacopsylla melanoneura TaxID=428564 RepID=A0A8D8Z4L0_9HEMI
MTENPNRLAMCRTFRTRTKLILTIFSLLGTSTVCFSLTPNCGGRLKSNFGVIITPNFPGKFPVPITCKWIIENTGESDRKRRSPGLFVNGNFDIDSETQETSTTTLPDSKPTRGYRRTNSTRKGSTRKQVRFKTPIPTVSHRYSGYLSNPGWFQNVTIASKALPKSTNAHINTTVESFTGDVDVIVVYFTQLFVTSGLTIKEYAYYEDESSKYAEKVIFSADEKSVFSELYVTTERPFLVIELGLDRLDTNHVRALDNLLDVYGFNVTYDVIKARNLTRMTSCSMATCSYNGHCYSSANFREFYCSCFEGFSGKHCERGPLCQTTTNCIGGATCRQLGSLHTSCECSPGSFGPSCLDCHNGTSSSCLLKCPGSSPSDGQLPGVTDSPCSCQATPQRPDDSLPRTSDTAIFEVSINVNVTSSVQRSLYFSSNASSVVQKAIEKYLGAINLGKLTNVRVLNITNYGDVGIQFVCSKEDGSKARDVFNKLVEKGRLGPFVLVPTKLSFKQHSSLVLKSLTANQITPFKPGEQLVLSCITQGSALANVTWYKDGALVNPRLAVRNITISSRHVPSSTTPSSSLVANVDSLDRESRLIIGSIVHDDAGVYSCRVEDWTSQTCRSVGVSVLEVTPNVRLHPPSLTVDVGSRVQLSCVSLNELRSGRKFGYNWTKNKKLFPNEPGHEIWEELSPGGSLLTVYNIQETTTYSCHVHGTFASVAKSLTVYVRRPSLGPLTCPPDRTPGNVASQTPPISWPETLSDVIAIRDLSFGSDTHVKQRPGCLVTRRCVAAGTRAEWRLPDFAKCPTTGMVTIRNNLTRLSLGFVGVSVSQMLTELRETNMASADPGSREVTVDILSQLLNYVNASCISGKVNDLMNQQGTLSAAKSLSQNGVLSNQQLVSWSDMMYDMVDLILRTENSLMNPEKLQQLFNFVQEWNHLRLHLDRLNTSSFLTVRNAFLTQNFHLNASNFGKQPVSPLRPSTNTQKFLHGDFLNVTQLYNHPVIVLSPQSFASLSGLHSAKVMFILDRNLTLFRQFGEEATLGVVVSHYNHRYKRFWPGKFNSKTRHDREDYFDYKAAIVAVSLQTFRRLSIVSTRSASLEIDFPMLTGVQSNLTCATKSAFDTHWDLGRCKTMLFVNYTKCVCGVPQSTGMFCVVGRGTDDTEFSFFAHQTLFDVLPLSFSISLFLHGITAAILFSRWLTRHANIVFLKLQGTSAHIGVTLVFLYAAQYDIDQDSHALTLNILEFLMLIALTCHVSTLLVVFTQLTLSPKIPHIKLSIITILTVIPILAVLCNSLSSSPSSSSPSSSWWLIFPSTLSYIFISYVFVLVVLYSFLYSSLLLKLHRLENKTRISQRGIRKRKGLLHRSCIIFTSMVVMETSSIVYINQRTVWGQWTFASSCVITGVCVLVCYVIYTESSRSTLLGKHREKEKEGVNSEQEYSSDSDPLHLFIKEEKDEENHSSAPYLIGKGGEAIPLSSLSLPPNPPDILEEQKQSLQGLHSTMGHQLQCVPPNGVQSPLNTTMGGQLLPKSSVSNSLPPEQVPVTPMKFVKFQDEILEASTNGVYQSRKDSSGDELYPVRQDSGEGIAYSNIILTVDPYQGGGSGGELVATTRLCVDVGIQGDSTSDPARITSLFTCSVDVEPGSHVLEHPVYENRYLHSDSGMYPALQDEPKVFTGDSQRKAISFIDGKGREDNSTGNSSNWGVFVGESSKQMFENGISSSQKSYPRKSSYPGVYSSHSSHLSSDSCQFLTDSNHVSTTDRVLSRITSDLDYILNQSETEIGSLKRSSGGQKGILKKKSSYGGGGGAERKSCEDVRVDERTSL